MPIYLSEEKRQYVEEFGDPLGFTLLDFFSKQLDFGGASGMDKRIPLKKRRFTCAKELVKLYGIDAVKKAMTIYEEKLRLGILYKKSVPYFKKIVESSIVKEPEIKEISKGIPIPIEKVTNHYEKDYLNWIYSCPDCSTRIDAWNERCPQCSIWFDWGKTDWSKIHVNQ